MSEAEYRTIKSTKHEIRNPKQYRNLPDDSQDSNVQMFKTYCFGDLNFGNSNLGSRERLIWA